MPRSSPARSRGRGSRCCSTTGARPARGVKFKDAELIGVPTIVVVGRGLADGTVELKDRRSGERREVAVASAVPEILAEVGRA
jgi:prolyl-tRNA synthetase